MAPDLQTLNALKAGTMKKYRNSPLVLGHPFVWAVIIVLIYMYVRYTGRLIFPGQL